MRQTSHPNISLETSEYKCTWQVAGCMIIVAIVLDKRWRGGNVAGLHRGHAGSSGHR